jgi:Acetyltransferase (GNAT) domain
MAQALSDAPLRPTDGPRGEVRPFRRADVAEVAALWRRCFPREPLPPPGTLETVVAEIFFDNPWRQADLPSLVYADDRGALIGFLGVVPRPMTLDGVPLRAAATTRLMVDPTRRGIAAFRLLQTFLAGPQDLSLADFASGSARAVWERLGGTSAVTYSIEWFRPLAPARAALGWLAHVSRSRMAGMAARSLGRMVDFPLTRLPGTPFRRPAARFLGERLSEDQLLHCLEESTRDGALRARYAAESLAWLLGMLRRKLRDLRSMRVCDGGETIGWFIYGRDHEVAQVVHMDWRSGRFGDVLRHLLADAHAHGAAAVSGRVPPGLLGELDDRLCLLRRAPWVLVHSRFRATLEAISRGHAVLSRMDGEWWIPL